MVHFWKYKTNEWADSFEDDPKLVTKKVFFEGVKNANVLVWLKSLPPYIIHSKLKWILNLEPIAFGW